MRQTPVGHGWEGGHAGMWCSVRSWARDRGSAATGGANTLQRPIDPRERVASAWLTLHVPPAPLVIPPPNVRPVPPLGGGSPSDGLHPQPQFQCNLEKNFLRRLEFPVLFGPSDGPPSWEGDYKGWEGGGV